MDKDQEITYLKEIIELQRKVIEIQSKNYIGGSWSINTNPSKHPNDGGERLLKSPWWNKTTTPCYYEVKC